MTSLLESTSKLIDNAAPTELADRLQASKVYRALLNRADAPRDGDAAQLVDAMKTLGKSKQDLKDDAAKIARERQLQDAIRSSDDLAPLEARRTAVNDSTRTEWLNQAHDVCKQLQPAHWRAVLTFLQEKTGWGAAPNQATHVQLCDSIERRRGAAEAAVANAERESKAAKVELENLRNDNPHLFEQAKS